MGFMGRDNAVAEPGALPLVPQRRSTTTMATICLFKSVVGTGIFAYPAAVREAGWVLCTAVAVVFFVINLYTMVVLNLAIVALREQGRGVDSDGRIEYHQLTAAVLHRRVNSAFLGIVVIAQLGTLASMTVFVVDQITSMVPATSWHVAVAMAVIVAPLCCLRTTGHAAFAAAMSAGSVAVLVGVGTLVYYGLGPHGGFRTASQIKLFDVAGLATACSISASASQAVRCRAVPCHDVAQLSALAVVAQKDVQRTHRERDHRAGHVAAFALPPHARHYPAWDRRALPQLWGRRVPLLRCCDRTLVHSRGGRRTYGCVQAVARGYNHAKYSSRGVLHGRQADGLDQLRCHVPGR